MPCTRSRTCGPAAIALAASAAAIALAFAFVRPASAQPPSPEPWHLEPIARYGGATHAVAGAGDVLYAGLGARVVALDIGDPAAPVQVGESPVLGGVVQDVVLEGELLYVAWQAGTPEARRGGLAVLGVADPTHIEVLREAPVDVATRRLAVADGVALMVGAHDWQQLSSRQRGAMVTVDPRPVDGPEIGEVLVSEYIPHAITVLGTAAYVLEPRAHWGDVAGIRVLDAKDPQRPQRVETIALPGMQKGIVATSTRLYVASGDSGLRVVDVDPGHRSRDLGRASPPGECADDVARSARGLAVLDACSNRLALYGLGDDGWPEALGAVELPVSPARAAWLGDLVVVAMGARGGVVLVDAERMDAPVVRGAWSPPEGLGSVAAVAASDDGQVLVAAHPEVGITTLWPPQEDRPSGLAGHLDVVGADHIDVMGDVLVTVGDRGDGSARRLDLIEVHDLAAPRLAGSLALPWGEDVVAHPTRRFVYVADAERGLGVVDATDVSDPLLAATLPEVTVGRVVRRANSLVGYGLNRLLTLDVSDPASPAVIGGLGDQVPSPFGSSGTALAATADRAFITHRYISPSAMWYFAKLSVIDIADAAQPKWLVNHPLPDEDDPRAMVVDGSALFLGGANGLTALDATALDGSLVQLMRYAAPGTVLDLALVRDGPRAPLVVAAEADAGLAIYRRAPDGQPQPTSTSAGPLPTPRPSIQATATPGGTRSLVYLPFASRWTVGSPNARTLPITYNASGPTLGLAMSDELAYVGHGDAILVIETGPGSPRLVGRTADLPGLVLDVVLADNRLYAAASEGGMAVLSLQDPRQPALLGMAMTRDAARGVAVSGSLAFVAAGESGLEVFDVTDPTAARRLSTAPTTHRAWGVKHYRDHVYVGTAAGPIEIFDVADPRQSRHVGSLRGDMVNYSGYTALAFRGDFAYAGTCSNCISVFDIADPTQPIYMTSLSGGTNGGLDLAIAGDDLYTTGMLGVSVYSLSDPVTPLLKSSLPLLWDAWQVGVRGGRMVTISTGNQETVDRSPLDIGTGTIEVTDVSDVQRPTYLGMLRPPFADAFTVLPSSRADHIYVRERVWSASSTPRPLAMSNPSRRLGPVQLELDVETRLLDIADRDAPRLAERVPELDDVSHMTVEGGIGYAIREPNTLAIIDVSSPANPVTLSTLALDDEVLESIAVWGRTIVLRGRTAAPPSEGWARSTLHVVDAADLARPTLRHATRFPGGGQGVAVSGDVAWMPVNKELMAVDIADAGGSRLVSRWPFQGLADNDWQSGIVVLGHRVYLGSSGGLFTVDVSDTAQLRLVGKTRGQVTHLWPQGGDRLLAGGCGVTLYHASASGPAEPIAVQDTLPYAPARCGLRVLAGLVVGDRLYAATNSAFEGGGLVVIDVGLP